MGRVVGTKRDTPQKIYRHFRQFLLPLAGKILNGYGISSQLPSRVRLASVKCLKLMLMLFVFCRAEAGVFSVPEFQVGDKPASNIVTPVHLVVVDQERTETLREREA